MSNEPDTTQWSLPGPADAPRDDLKLQLEVYGETILLRGFDGDAAWVRTVSADEIANVFTQHLGFSSGLLPQDAVWWNQGETGTGGGPVEAATGLVRGPATGGVQAPRPAPASHAGAGLRLLAGPRPLGLRRSGAADRRRAAPLPGPRLQRLRRRAGLPRKPPVPGGGGTDTGVLLPVLLLPYRRHARDRSKKHPENLVALWEEIDGKTEYPMEDLVPQCSVAHAMAVSEGRRGYRYG